MSHEHPVLFCRSWTAAKAGNTPEQNEDACRCQPFLQPGGPEGWLVALADGAAEAVYAGPWARTLVSGAEPDWPALNDHELTARLDSIRRGFSPLPSGQEVPWYVRNKYLTQGSQATVLVATLTAGAPADGLLLRAVSVGDSCLLVFKGTEGVTAFPVRTSEDFGLHPRLVCSRAQPELPWRRWEGSLRPHDLLLACTDAVAKWALQCAESRRADVIFKALATLLTAAESEPPPPARDAAESAGTLQMLRWFHRPPRTPDPAAIPIGDFEPCVRRYRLPESRPSMRNDDSTLVACLSLPGPDGDLRQSALHALARLASPAVGTDARGTANYPMDGV